MLKGNQYDPLLERITVQGWQACIMGTDFGVEQLLTPLTPHPPHTHTQTRNDILDINMSCHKK